MKSYQECLLECVSLAIQSGSMGEETIPKATLIWKFVYGSENVESMTVEQHRKWQEENKVHG